MIELMETLEQEQLPKNGNGAHGLRASIPSVFRSQSGRRAFLRAAVAELFVFAVSVALAGLWAQKNRLIQSSLADLDEFKWIVFVQGDQIAIDEVGRYLKQI